MRTDYTYLSYGTDTYLNTYTTYRVVPYKFGFSGNYAKAVSGSPFSFRVPFSRSDLFFKTEYEVSLVSYTGDSVGTYSDSTGILSIPIPLTATVYKFRCSRDPWVYYSDVKFTVSDSNELILSTISASTTLKPGEMIQVALSYSDDVYGSTSDTHAISISGVDENMFAFFMSESEPMLIWAPQTSGVYTVTVNISNIGGRSSFTSKSFVANNPPTVEAIPNSICYATGIFSYSLIIEDLDDDDIDVTGTSGIDLSYDEFDVSQPVSGTFTGILTVSDGINTARTDLTLIFKAAPYIKTGYTSIVCYVDYLCIVKITDMINTDDYFDIDSDMFFMESSDYFYNTFNVASTVETYNIGIYYDDYCMVDIVHELTTNYILAISSITAEWFSDTLNSLSYTYSATYNTVADTGITAIVSPGSFTATATTITGTISASDHGKIFTVSASKLIPKSYGLQYFTISYITCRTPTSVSSNFNAYYGVPFTAFFLSESDGSFAYSLTSSTEYIKIDEFKGVVTWDNPTGSSASFVVNLLDWRCTDQSATYNIDIIRYPALISYPSLSSFQVFKDYSTSLVWNSDLDVTASIIPNTPTITSISKVLTISISTASLALEDSYTVRMTNDNQYNDFYFYLSVLNIPKPVFTTTLYTDDARCAPNQAWELHLSRYIFKYPDNLEGLLSVTLASASVTASINDGKVMLTTSSSNSITLNACIGVTYCVSQIYAFDCIDMTISFPDTADAYKNVLYQQQIEVYNGADQININSLENLSIIGDSKPSNMKITSAGVIEWTPSSSYAGTTITITVLASATINSILYSGKFYTVTKTLDIKIDSHVLFIVNFSIIPYYWKYCGITIASINASCYVKRPLDEVLNPRINGVLQDVTYSVTTSPNDLNVYIDTYDVLRWDRSYLTSTDSSSLIYLTVTDSLGAKLTLDPFRFEPNFIPLISDLTSPVEIKDDAIYVAYTNSFWQRSFTITDGLGTSTTVSSNDLNAQNTEVTLNPTSSTFTFSNGMILWTPDEIMTHTLTVKYSDMAQPAYNVTRQFIIEVEDNNQPIFITISESKRIAIIGQIYTIEFSDHWIDLDGDDLIFEINNGFKTGMLVEPIEFSWTPTSNYAHQLLSVEFKYWDKHKYWISYTVITISVQPRLCLSLTENKAKYQTPFLSLVQICEETRSLFKLDWLEFSLMSPQTLPVDFTISAIYGDLNWVNPMIYEIRPSIKVTYKASSSSYEAYYTNTFTITLELASIYPSFGDTLPLNDALKTATANTMWIHTVYCSHPLFDVDILIEVEDDMGFDLKRSEYVSKFDSWDIKWIPTIYQTDSKMIHVTCTAVCDDLIEIKYSFIIAPVIRERDLPTCEDGTAKLTQWQDEAYQLLWKDRDSKYNEITITIDKTLYRPEGFNLYKWGYFDWTPVSLADSKWVEVTIHNNQTTNKCELFIDTIDAFQDPDSIQNIDAVACQDTTGLSCSLDITIYSNGEPFNFELNVTDYFSMSNGGKTAKWQPPDNLPYEYLKYSALSFTGSRFSTDTLLCQGVQCRLWPLIESVECGDDAADYCTKTDKILTYDIFMPETRVSIIIKGHNFGNDADVWIGNKLCECLPNNDNEIECIVPMPTFYFINGLFVTVKRNDLGYTNSVKKLINYKQNRVPVLFAPAISPLYLYPDNDGDVTIPINADLILPFCRCFIRNSGLIEGIFDYQSQVYSECVIEDDSSSGDYNVEVCCYGVCSSDTYTVHILTSILYSVTPNRGHNHGLYNVAGVLSFLGTYMASDIIFLVDDVYIGFSDLNSNSFAFQMPPIEDAAIDKIRISVNHGYSFTNDNWSTDFDFTGRCDIGEFINENLCEDCPVGNYCDENFLTSTAYFFSHKPCDLGEYQDLTGQSSCKTCPVGRQCYCRGMSETAECDAGYVCSDTGTIKRFRACTNGAYCLPGTTKSKSEDDISDNPNSPIKCDIGTYCIYGIYDKTVNDSDKYTAKNCDVPANCPRGSTNRQGLRDCQWGFFCIDLVSITRVGLLDSNDLDELCDDDGKCSCPRGYSCPSSVLTAPKQCDSGYYQDLEEQGTCKLCDSGYYCTNTNSQAPESRTICTLGNRCPSMSTKPTKCPVGTYQDKTGQTDCKNCPIGTYNNQLGRSSCKICESGFMCAEEGISTNKLLCPDGYYCGIGTNMNKPECDINFKSDNKTEIYPIPCNTGTQCQGGSGTFKLCGLRMYNGETCQSSCKFCPNGTTCTTTGMSKPELCKEGYACYDFASVLCKAGHYCLEGTETNDPKNTATEKRPLPCSKGHYCTGGNTMGTYLSSKRNSAAYCNIGQYNNETGAISCKNCPAGHECLKTEMTEPILCLGGTWRAEGLTPISCVSCEEGFYNNNTGSISKDACIKCPAGIVCKATGASWLNSTVSEDCPAGYYCIAGTSRSTRNINRCPEGTFCFTKTESKDQAILNPCPAGRYCASATGATTQGYDDCKNTINCNIGVACEPGKYCLKGYANMTTCPTGTTSSSGAKSVKECFRDVLKFYDVRIITTHEAYPKFIVEANSYHEFTLDFKHAYTDATLPNDLQQTTIITPIDENGRILSDVDKSTRVMIISHKSYSAKQSIPLNNDQSWLLTSDRKLILGFQSNIRAEIKFEIEYLDGLFHETKNWTKTNVTQQTMQKIKDNTHDKGFLFVVTREIGEIISDPINIYKIFGLNATYKSINDYMQLENRFFLTIVTNDTKDAFWNETKVNEYSFSMWDNLTVDTYPISYIPYISSCYPGYGSNIGISSACNDHRCKFADNPKPVTLYGLMDEVEGTSCEYQLVCDYGLDITFLNRDLRWYEAESARRNAKDSAKQALPPFYVTKDMFENSEIELITSLDRKVNSELIPINIKRKMDDSAWTTGDVPQTVELQIGYYLKTKNTKVILVGDLVLSDFQQGTEFNQTTYDFVFKFYPLSWIEVFDYNGFTWEQYSWLLLLASIMLFCSIAVLFLITGLIWCPVSCKFKGIKYIFCQFINSMIGFFMICLPLIVEIVIIYSFFVLGAVFDQKVGNFQDKIPIAGSDDPKIQLYQAGRMGTCFIIMGLTLIKWGTDFMIPPTTQMGFSYQEEMQKYKEIEQLQRRQGLVVGSISFVCFIGMFLVCFADSPIFEDYYYVILPLLKFFEYLLSLVFLKGFRDQLYIMPIRFGLKMSILIMILSFEKLHKMIAGYVILFIMRIFEESLYVRFHQTFVLSYFSKTFEKTEGLRQKDSKLRRKYINSLSELGDKSTSVLITWMYPVVVAFVYLFYDFTAYSILQIHFLYYLIFLIFFIAFEPLVQILINYLRILSDRSYFCPAIHEHSSLNFKQRQTSWSLSYLKIHDESLDLSGQVKTLFCTGFSAQLYLLLSTLGFGMIIFMIGVKLLSYNSYSPFLDYWLFLFGLFTYVTCLILKILTIRIGKKIGWKISSLNNLYQIDARGEIIRSREDYIQDRFVRAAMNNASKQDNTVDMMISETSDDVIQLIKNQENRALLSFRIGEMLNKFEIISKLDKDKIFKDIQRKADVFSAEQLREKIQAASDPIYKINLIATQRIKECRSHPKFPVELLYKWR